jgi:hypothetical protein
MSEFHTHPHQRRSPPTPLQPSSQSRMTELVPLTSRSTLEEVALSTVPPHKDGILDLTVGEGNDDAYHPVQKQDHDEEMQDNGGLGYPDDDDDDHHCRLEAWSSFTVTEAYLAEQRRETDRKFLHAMALVCALIVLGVILGNYFGIDM